MQKCPTNSDGTGVAHRVRMDELTNRAFPLGHLTYRIIGVFLDVARELGHGFSELVYCRALTIVLLERGFDVQVEQRIPVHFHGEVIGLSKRISS